MGARPTSETLKMWPACVSQELLPGRWEERSFKKPQQWLTGVQGGVSTFSRPPRLFVFFPLICFSFSSGITQSPKWGSGLIQKQNEGELWRSRALA